MAKTRRNGDRTLAEVRQELDNRKKRIERRLTEVQSEVSSFLPSVTSMIADHPVASLGGALAAGLCAGYLLGASRSCHTSPNASKSSSPSDFIEDYVVPVIVAMRKQVDGGSEPQEALRAAIRDHLLMDDVASDTARRRQNYLLLSHLLPLVMDIGLQWVNRLEGDEKNADSN